MKNRLILPLLLLLVSQLSFAQIANIGGIKTNTQTGLQSGIEVPLPKDSSLAEDHLRTAELLSMIFDNELNVTLNLRINYYTPGGVLMSDAIDSDTTLSYDAKQYRKRMFASFTVSPKTTGNSLIDAATEQVLVGEPLAGHTYIPELLGLQQLTRSNMSALGVAGVMSENRPLQLVYKMIMLKIPEVLRRNGLIH